MGTNKLTTNLKQNIYVCKIPKNFTAAELEDKFKDIAPVKSCKVSVSPLTVIVNRNGKNIKEVDLSQPPVSNGYGFVCFQNAEDATKVLSSVSEL
jgi:RNA recognition motif-containing protein